MIIQLKIKRLFFHSWTNVHFETSFQVLRLKLCHSVAIWRLYGFAVTSCGWNDGWLWRKLIYLKTELSFMSSWANAHRNYVRITVLTSIHINTCCFRPILHPKPVGSGFPPPVMVVMLSPLAHRLKCISSETYYGLNSPFKLAFLNFKTSVHSKSKDVFISKHWPMEQTTPETSHAVDLQDDGAFALKVIEK